MLTNIKKNELLGILLLAFMVLTINISPLTVNAGVYGVSSSIEQYRVNLKTKDYITETSEHFIYKYTLQDKDILSLVKSETEESYNQLFDVFKNSYNDKVLIIIFPNTKTMNETLKLPQEQKSIGLYYCGFISILSPNEWITDKNKQKFEDAFRSTGPVLHELTHYFVDKRTRGNYPLWFTEGVALYFEKQFTGFEWGKGIKYKIEPYRVDELDNNFLKLDSNYAYRRSYEIILEYVNKKGINNLLNIMDRLGEGYSLEDFDK